MEGLTEGRIVHYVLPDGKSRGASRPAIVVNSWPDVNPELRTKGYCNLMVFVDGDNDYEGKSLIWATSKTFSENGEPGTWHWIPKA